MSDSAASLRERILVWAPTLRDGQLAVEILARHGIAAEAFGDIEELCRAIEHGAAGALIPEERLTPAAEARLVQTLKQQPAWSDFPIIVLGVRRSRYTSESARNLEPLGNVTLLDPPLRVRTLVRAGQSAIRARGRQYEAQRAIEERDRFLAMLGHELRNPLNAIALASFGISEGADPKRYVGVLTRQVAQLTRLVDDLLDVARVSSGKILIQRGRVALDGVLRHASEALRGRFDEAGVTLELTIEPCWVEGDSARLEQVFGNLLTNAVKYTSREGRVTVHAHSDGPVVTVTVTDTGVGIDAAILPTIFEPFVQVESSLDRAQGGMGVGLSLVRTLVALHGGSVDAESAGPGRGSCFVVRLPRAPSSGEASPPRPLADAATTDCNLVVVEDNVDARELLVAALEGMGYGVQAAPDGGRGLDLIVASRPAAAIVDIGLPVLDGYELARRVRASEADGIRLIALTGYGQPADRERALAAGFDAHLTKPVDLGRLRHMLDALLEPRASA